MWIETRIARIARLIIVGNCTPYSNKCNIFSSIFYVWELTSFTVAFSLSLSLSEPHAFEPREW
jgi:hypothetical protein